MRAAELASAARVRLLSRTTTHNNVFGVLLAQSLNRCDIKGLKSATGPLCVRWLLKGYMMNDHNQYQSRAIPANGAMDMSVDAGLRGFMLGVYNKMGLGLVLSAVLAFITSQVPMVRDMLFIVAPDGRVGVTGLGMIVQFAPLAILFGSMFMMKNPSRSGANLMYWAVVSLIGAGLGVLAFRYNVSSLASTFMITAAAFGALSLWGYTTKKDLTGFGTFLIMGLFGLILASIVNIFLKSSAMDFVISGLGVLIFSGLIAFDTQRLKFDYYQLAGNDTALSVATSFGALSLYLNFVNLFQFLLSFLGNND
jgi:uncharacterized protein